MFYSSLVGAMGKVHAYEAHPGVFQKLTDRFKNFRQVSTHNYAVSNQSEFKIKMKIYPDEIQHECATVEETLMSSERMPGNTTLISVPCQKLDTHLNEVAAGRCSFIKIDVEGHEHAVLDGAAELIQKHRPVIVYEYGYESGKFEPRTIEQMNNFGYASFDCNTLKIVHPKYIPFINVTDLVAIPLERVPNFEALISLLK